MSQPVFKMSLGQMTELFLLLILPLLMARFGIKKIIIAGMIAWIVQFTLFTFGAPGVISSMIVLGIVLHGLSYDFVFVATQAHLEARTPQALKGEAQKFLVFILYGFGMLIGTLLSGGVYSALLQEQGILTGDQWRIFWLLPAILCGVVLLLYLFSYFEAEEDLDLSDPGQSMTHHVAT